MKEGDVLRARKSGIGCESGVEFKKGDLVWIKKRSGYRTWLLHMNGDISGCWNIHNDRPHETWEPLT